MNYGKYTQNWDKHKPFEMPSQAHLTHEEIFTPYNQ